MDTSFLDSFSQDVWATTYKDHKDQTIDDTLHRVAKSVASVEKTEELKKLWEERFYCLLTGFKMSGGGRILANAGTDWHGTTLMNCLHGNTEVLTYKGIKKIKDIVGQTVTILNKNKDWVPVEFKNYGKQLIFKISLSNGDVILASENHRWFVKNSKSSQLEEVTTKDLLNRQIPYIFPKQNQIQLWDEFKYGVYHGLVRGDGNLYLKGKYSILHQFGDSCHLVRDYFDSFTVGKYRNPNIEKLSVNRLPADYKTTIPSTNSHSVDYVKGYLAGLVASDGCVDKYGSVMLFQSDEDFLYQIKDLAAQVGIVTTSIKMYREKNPFNGKISPSFKLSFLKSSFPDEMIIKNNHKKYRKNKPSKINLSLKVIGLENTNNEEQVFCCQENLTSTFVLGNFLLTGNCFVGPKPKHDQDSLEGIYEVLLKQAKTLKSEGGWGMNFSFIRPRGSFIHGIGSESPGPVRFMELFDVSSAVITSGSGIQSKNKKAKNKIRKGAQMAIMDIWHPSIEEFITAKVPFFDENGKEVKRLSKFNLSVNCSNEFMDKVAKIEKYKLGKEESITSTESDSFQAMIDSIDEWDLIFPDTMFEHYKTEWDGNMAAWKSKGYPVIVYKTVKVSDLWASIMQSTYNRNDPGVLFLDRANETHCWNYGGNKAHIAATNPCISKGTLVNTPIGYCVVESIKIGDNISSLHPRGYEAVTTIEKHNDIPVFKVSFSDGGEQIVTAAHRYHVQRKGSNSKFIQKLRLDEIKVGDFVQVSPTKLFHDKCDKNHTVVFQDNYFSQNDYEIGMMLGILLGNGSCGMNMSISTSQQDVLFNQNVKNLFNKHFYTFNKDNLATDGSKSMSMPFSSESLIKLHQAFQFPDKFYACSKSIYYDQQRIKSPSYLVGIINGLLATDGNVNLRSNHPQICFDTCSKNLAQDIRRVLLLLGVHGRISTSHSEGGIINDRKIHRVHPKYTVSVSGTDFKTLGEFCFNNINPDKQAKITTALYNAKLSGNSRSAEVLSIESAGRAEVYDLYCEESDTWITEGYVQQGCGEQCLPFGFVCNLASMNLTQFVKDDGQFNFETFEQYVGWAIRFLDNVNDLTNAPLEEYVKSIREKRRVGLGVMGWGSMLYMMKIRFGSKAAEFLKEQIMRALTWTGTRVSIALANEKGAFEGCDPIKHSQHKFFTTNIGLPLEDREEMAKYGIRNSALFSCQPTGNTGILANIVSGGIEPVFFPEYTRTVIVDGCPPELLALVPKYWVGEFKETDAFKWYSEGEDKILRAEINGTVYKIDRNRGLTKEVSCIDYGVRWLKAKNEWDAKAEWAVTASSLSVQDHLTDMKGFSKWIDSSISKTVNLPNDYPYVEFQNLYLEAYKSGVLKGITTYRAGTMMNVLAAPMLETKPIEEKIFKTNAPKRPSELSGELHHFLIGGKKYYVVVGLIDNEPYEVFTGVNETKKEIFIPKNVKYGKIKKQARGKYVFICVDKEEYDLTNGHSDDTADALSRIISCSLRHGADISFIVHQLEKTDGPMISFSKVLARTLKRYIKDGTKVSGEECPECKKGLIRQEGCCICPSCGFSKCS